MIHLTSHLRPGRKASLPPLTMFDGWSGHVTEISRRHSGIHVEQPRPTYYECYLNVKQKSFPSSWKLFQIPRLCHTGWKNPYTTNPHSDFSYPNIFRS